MRTPLSRRLLASSGLAAALWLLVVLIRWGFSQIPGGAAQLANLVPQVAPRGLLWGDSGGWLVLAIALGAVAVALVHAFVTTVAGRGGALFLPAWFAAVAAGAVVGLAFDVAVSWDSLAMFGPRGLLVGEFGAGAASGALWGLAAGWMPGLVVRAPAEAPASARDDRRPGWLLPAAAVAVVAVIAGGVAADNARTTAIAAETAARQQAEAAVTFGAMPDPNATGVPVPSRAEASTELDPNWCTPDKATVLKGEPDAATGHRGMPIQLMNFSDQPCVIEGYPDIAFEDQNGHLLAVTIEQGSSFMAQDPGPQRIEVPAGGYAVTYLGWDAASPHGALVTKTVYAAQTAGMERGSWPIDLDIVEGSTVAVTAWQIDENPVVTY
ncbi:DUF4232 domain-containing protein [Microbacterium kyungheense]|uniref:Uncharacterized protein DUF4232 n=1 Tax=Microbacterium kyungheense TaxID=1263636 RepID=A0A543ETZ3_9MICO|nr:DUF4232 domain-containing protein [Microbacterium kyungheense]TQM25052.1 uncharacterized protein DUF4232 [Microbacterium kyungheense]